LSLLLLQVHEGFQISLNDVLKGHDLDGKKSHPVAEVVKELFPNEEKPAW
jgi:hypothetical protein